MEILLQQELRNSMNVVTQRLSELVSKTNHGVLVNDKSGLVVHTKLQAVFNLKFAKKIEQSIHEIIVNHALNAEKLGPGGFDKCLKMTLENVFSTKLITNHQLLESLSECHEKSRVAIHANHPTLQDIDWLVECYTEGKDDFVKKMISEAIMFAGFGGKISVEKSTNDHASVELIRGYVFEHDPIWNLNIKFDKPRIACIDGFVETVSEVNCLLEEASTAKEPLVLVTRGLADDVKQTLRVNYDRGTLRVIPVIVKYDLEGINTLNDIAACVGTDVLNTHKGEMINSMRFHQCKRVDSVILQGQKFTIVNASTKKNVEKHVAFLRKKREEQIEDVSCLIDKRIKCLSPNHVVIRLPDDRSYVIRSQTIDYVLRAIKTLIQYGTIFINGEKMLTSTAIGAITHSDRCCETLKSIGAAIT